MTSILWYRRDLRVHDLPALPAAAEQGPVLPVFVLDDRLLGGRRASANRTWFMLESLRALDEALWERGTRLHIRRGRPEQVIPELALACGADAVYVSRDYAPFGRRRDERTGRALNAVGVELIEMAGALAQEPEEILTGKGAPFSVFGPFRRKWESLPRRTVLPAPGRT
ncbi:MAG TPA: deoxyribodipyrimidine photo-lyase, partial [Tepidiformaceae bacterium]|nr:deoxyribodipyrimidine photo-lyase [Tepidiformaceae bacterium]